MPSTTGSLFLFGYRAVTVASSKRILVSAVSVVELARDDGEFKVVAIEAEHTAAQRVVRCGNGMEWNGTQQ